MRDHAAEAVAMLGGRTVEQVRHERQLQLALIQLLQIVGEAAARVPLETRNAYPQVPWQLAADMRNRLVHGYDVLDYQIVFDTVRNELPDLTQQLDEILAGRA